MSFHCYIYCSTFILAHLLDYVTIAVPEGTLLSQSTRLSNVIVSFMLAVIGDASLCH